MRSMWIGVLVVVGLAATIPAHAAPCFSAACYTVTGLKGYVTASEASRPDLARRQVGEQLSFDFTLYYPPTPLDSNGVSYVASGGPDSRNYPEVLVAQDGPGTWRVAFASYFDGLGNNEIYRLSFDKVPLDSGDFSLQSTIEQFAGLLPGLKGSGSGEISALDTDSRPPRPVYINYYFAVTPVPPAFALFASALGGLGLIAVRRRRG